MNSIAYFQGQGKCGILKKNDLCGILKKSDFLMDWLLPGRKGAKVCLLDGRIREVADEGIDGGRLFAIKNLSEKNIIKVLDNEYLLEYTNQ